MKRLLISLGHWCFYITQKTNARKWEFWDSLESLNDKSETPWFDPYGEIPF